MEELVKDAGMGEGEGVVAVEDWGCFEPDVAGGLEDGVTVVVESREESGCGFSV